jgi:phage terminase large subunit
VARTSLRGFEDFYSAISTDIFKFAEALRFTPTQQQVELFQAIQDAKLGTGPRRLACKSGQGPGKTAASVIGGLWCSFLDVDALTVVTAPTMRQLRDVWLAEARRRVERAEPIIKKLFTVTKSKIEICGRPDWGVKLVTASREENAQGYHEENMTVIAEEASGIPREIITQFKGTLSNQNSLFLQIGNPNTRDCAFFDCFNSQRHLWRTMTWNAEDTARDHPEILDPTRNAELEEEFGRDSDVYRIRVLGEFPHSDPNCVISSEELEHVCGREYILAASQYHRPMECGGGLARQIGLDFARYGGDESTIYRRSGNAIPEWAFFAHTDPSEVVARAFRMQVDAGWHNQETMYVADAGGMGQGIMHKFYDADKRVLEFHNGGRPIDSKRYENRITEGWFHLARLVRARACALPKDNQTIQQLSGRRYYTNKKGKLVLETKDEYMKRGFNSPDRGDGIVYAMYDHVEAVGHHSGIRESDRTAGVELRS